MTFRGSSSRMAPVFCGGLGPILFGSMSLVCGMATTPAYGQESAPAPVAFDIPTQSLASALNAWAVQAGAQVFFEQAPVAGRTAPTVSGSMAPREALHALLADSGLDFIQNKEGAYVVRPAVVEVAHHRAPAKPVAATMPAAEAPPPPPAATEARSARDDEGPWELRLRGTYLDPRHRSDRLNLPSTPTTSVPTDDTRTDHTWSAELDLEYYFNSYWSTELALNLPRVQELNFRNSTYASGNVGDFRMAPNFLTFKYNFLPDSAFRPYIGAGINVTSFYDVNAGPFSLTRTTTGPAAQAGFDVHLSEHWLLNADVKWARVTPAVAFDGAHVGRMDVDPVLVGVGIGYRFGGSPPPPPPQRVAAPPPVAPPPPPPDSDGDGVPDSLDQCPNTPPGVQVDAVGCPLDSDHDGVPDYLDKCPGTPPGLKVDAQGCEIEELVLRGVNFRTNSAELEPESAEILDGVVAVLRQRPDAKAEIHGYTDTRGSDAYNLKLSERRAASVVDYLVAHGIARDGLRAVGFGKDNPVASNDTVEGRAQNRRVTVQFSKPIRR
jgi:outer membrane protein OmpA-like peptidoglycan-associated protein/outer membrane protein W